MRDPYYADPHASLYLGDCLAVMAEMEPDSIDAIVTDPPYGLSFMGREWDRGVPGEPFWREMLRVAKPGAYLLAFGGTRTMHRITTAIEDAGWEIRDMLAWCYAEGFPKGPDVGRQIDMMLCDQPGRHWMRTLPPDDQRQPDDHVCAETPEGRPHYGVSTTLKPAWEPIVLARKPMPGTVAANVLAHGTGALQIDATRIPVDPADPVNEATWVVADSAVREGPGFVSSNEIGERRPARPIPRESLTRPPSVVDPDSPAGFGRGKAMGGGSMRVPKADPANRTGVVGRDLRFTNGDAAKMQEAQERSIERLEQLGRWPANVILTDPVFDGGWEGVVGGGMQRGGGNPRWASAEAAAGSYGGFAGGETGKVPVDTWGGYSRFFLIPKADRGERERGLRGEAHEAPVGGAPRTSAMVCVNCGSKRIDPGPGRNHVCRPDCPEKRLVYVPIENRHRVNRHPTVKPIELMRHLVRLVTPPGGIVLDPFLGSGTTALAASEEGRRAIGIEQQEDYLVTSLGRLSATPIGLGL